MSLYAKIMILGWIFLIISWTIGFVVKHTERKRAIAITANAFALGLFTAGLLVLFS